jgi:hypothetical protein
MKNLFLTLILSATTTFSFTQKALSFSQAKSLGISTDHLDSTYASGIHSDSTLSVFHNKQEEYIKAYQKLLQDLGNYLKKNNFIWEKPVKGFNRIYFNKDGKIDYFLYSFRPDQITAEQEKRFGELLSKFIKKYRFPLKADRPFAQCSPVTYMPADK